MTKILPTHSGVCTGCGVRYTITPKGDVIRGHVPAGKREDCDGARKPPRRNSRRKIER